MIYGSTTFIRPSTSPILILTVITAVISDGEIICANCEFVSILSSLGFTSKTFAHGSRRRFTQTFIIRSISRSSISEKSRSLSNGSPFPPSNRSTIVYPSLEAISIMIFPFSGEKSTTPRRTGFDKAFENSI